MNLIRNSNSIVALKKKPISPFKMIKNIIIVVSVILLSTSLISFVYLKIMDERYVSNNKFVRIDGKKYHYNIEGVGNYTVILDTVLGADMKATEELSSKIAKKYDCKVFTYNRMGYSYNESTDMKSIENQAEDLRMILKKAGVSGPYVLVGEEYGSLVMGAFARLYPDKVAGMTLLNPLTKDMLYDKSFLKSYSSQKLKRNFEKVSSYLGIEIILEKVGFIDYPDSYEELLGEEELKEFRINRIRPSYTYSYYSELMNILNFYEEEFNNDIFKSGAIGDRPLSILTKSEYRESQENLISITTKEDETHSFLSEEDGILTMRDIDGTYEAISYVLDRVKIK